MSDLGGTTRRLPQMQHRQRMPRGILLGDLADRSLQSPSHCTDHLNYTVCRSGGLPSTIRFSVATDRIVEGRGTQGPGGSSTRRVLAVAQASSGRGRERESIAISGSHWLRLQFPPGSNELRLRSYSLRRTHIAETETAAVRSGDVHQGSTNIRGVKGAGIDNRTSARRPRTECPPTAQTVDGLAV